MNSIILNYLLKKFLKTIFIFVFVFYCFGIILNLFEEVEFFKNLNVSITLPLILPGVISGGLFAFVTSFDEVVVVLFLAGLDNTTIPIQMWTGLREQLSPTILAVATCLIILSVLILLTAELLRRRSERLRGINR